MAPKSSSRRPSTPPSRPSVHRSYGEHVESAEVKRSRKAAILQLKIGRLAHIIGIASGLALALTAVIAYGLINWEFLSSAPEFMVTLKWIIPLVAGAAVAAVALATKWEPYYTDREETHFVMSIVAMVAPAFIIALVILDEYNYVQLGRPAWLYPASLLGICLTEISLAMTWEGSSTRRTISIVAAIFPIALLVFPMVSNFTPEELARILPMAYLGSAAAIQLSGSMLHIIASSTSVQQREVLKASDSKLKEQLKDIDNKRKALAYREDALRSRESDLETYEKRITDEMASVEEHKTQVVGSEKEIEQRLQQLRADRERLAQQEAAFEGERETLRIKLTDVDSQKKELEKRSKSIVAKDESLLSKEREANKLLLEAQSKDREMKNRLSEIEAEESTQGTMRKELESLQDALAEREKQIGVRESALDMKSLEVVAAREQLGTVAADKMNIKSVEQQLLMRQESLSEKEINLRAMEDDLRKKAERAERLTARADKQINELVEKESSLLKREQTIAEKEAGLRAEIEKLNSGLEEMQSAKVTITDHEKQYFDLTETTRSKLTAVSVREEEMARKMAALEKREEKIKELELRLKTEHDSMNSKLRGLLEKEKDLKAEEAEIGLRHAELRAMEQEVLESVEEVEEVRAEVPEEDEGQERTLDYREKRLVEKEKDAKSRLYQREKELEKREESLRVHLQKDIEGMEEAVEEEYSEEKVKTGMERLDDLLMGGMPFGSNVLFVGPPFIGKEVAMLLFVAEGLRKGVPAVIVTTSRPPSEISKEMAPILPTFMEFEQVGLVYWIDASGMQTGVRDESATETKVTRVSGPGNFKAITDAVDACIKSIAKQKQPYFRLAYMSLSMSITQSDEKSSFQFIQSLAGRLKQGNGVSVFAVERGMHTEQQLESIQHHMTGSVQFKTDKQKTLLSVQGVGDAQTRDWIEYKHSNKALMIGAFSLERIR